VLTATGLLEDAPVLWYANRASGVVLLVLLTIATVAGVLAAIAPGSQGWPRMATQALHRNVALLAMVFLGVHIATAVADEFIDIRWWHSVVPFAAAYDRAWLGLGAVAVDLMIAIIVTTSVRRRLGHGPWRAVHVTAYAAWAFGAAHGVGIGTDGTTRWGLAVTAGCLAAVAIATGARLAAVRRRPPAAGAPTARPVAVGRRAA
jgi:DMSO/TMAO reductase YedYZ heme-binding membrane subunit